MEHTNSEKVVVGAAGVAGGVAGASAGMAMTTSVAASYGAGVALACSPLGVAAVAALGAGWLASKIIDAINE